jgi:uncharacterized protein Yka (UPF0111/DUF47 family)
MVEGSGKIISCWELTREDIIEMIRQSERQIAEYQKVIKDLKQIYENNEMIIKLEARVKSLENIPQDDYGNHHHQKGMG